MTEAQQRLIGAISEDIDDRAGELKRKRREIADLEDEIADLEARRWALVLTP